MEFKHMPMNGANYTDADIKRLIAEYNVQFIKLQFVDINGQVKNLSVPAGHIEKVLANEIMHIIKDNCSSTEDYEQFRNHVKSFFYFSKK